jgi:allantoicase
LHATSLTVTEQKQQTNTMVDLLQGKLGGQCLSTSDEFFAECSNLVKPGRGITNDLYTVNGKWMDGWESRRKRTPGHDWAVLKLGLPGMIKVVDVDTNNFIGNYPYHASLDAAELPDDVTQFEKVQWTQILPKVPLNATSQHIFRLDEQVTNNRYTHLRLHIYPDGGVARLRIYGDVSIDWNKYKSSDVVDLAAVENGGVAIYTSDEHFGVKSNINSPGRGVNMGDGWETRRRRGPGNDWLVMRLGATCKSLKRIEIDTAHFKGNFPDRASIEGIYLDESIGANVALGWTELLSQKKLQADTQHYFESGDFVNADNVNVNHVRLNIYPDGGVSRLRVWCVRSD